MCHKENKTERWDDDCAGQFMHKVVVGKNLSEKETSEAENWMRRQPGESLSESISEKTAS